MSKFGDHGPEIEALQAFLNSIGYSLDVDGNFGPKTEAAVISFQSHTGLVTDGIVGPATQAAINNLEQGKRPTKGLVLGSGEYSADFASMQIRSSWAGAANSAADLIMRGMNRYQNLSAQTNVPWFLIGVIHLMESDCDFTTHLHNGDPLTHRTIHVPAGRPVTGTPPFTWEEAAADALNYDHIKPPLDNIDEQFSALEHYNGMGYRSHGIKTPYLWSGSNLYISGKYVSDGNFSISAVSSQIGAAPVIKVLANKGLI